jgi:trans-aconitate methyltransferase
MLEILAYLEGELARGRSAIPLDVVDPDLGRGHYAGEPSAHGLHRPLRVWLDLAERLGLRLRTPRSLDDGTRLRLTFEPLDRGAQIRGANPGSEKYGTQSDFARIRKSEDPAFVLDLREALQRVAAAPLAEAPRVLYLGCNTGDEIELVRALSPRLRAAQHVGVDHSASAIAAARQRFAADKTITFHEADLAVAEPLASLGRFDLVVSIGTLQSGALDDRDLLRRIVQDSLAPRGALILGIPNCRYVDGEVEYGARMKNFRQPELGLLVKDIAFYRKYMQQHHRQVFVTGKHYLFVTAVDERT